MFGMTLADTLTIGLGALGLLGGAIVGIVGWAVKRHRHQIVSRLEAGRPSEPTALWRVLPISGSRYEVRNIGTHTALRAALTDANGGGPVRPEDKVPRDVEPGDSLAFLAFRVSGPDPRYLLRWVDAVSGAEHKQERDIRR